MLVLDDADVDLVSQAVQAVIKKIYNETDKLNRLDAVSGDGDTGTAFARAADALAHDLANGKIAMDRPSVLFRRLGLIAESRMGGTCGASETIDRRTSLNPSLCLFSLRPFLSGDGEESHITFEYAPGIF